MGAKAGGGWLWTLAEGEAASVGIYPPPTHARVVLSDLCNGQREFEVGRSAYLGVTACPAVDGGHQIYASGSCRDRGLQNGAGVVVSVVDTATLNADPPPPPSGHMQCVFHCTSNYIAGGQSHDIFCLKLSRMVGAGARVRTIGRNLQVAEVEVDLVTTTSNLGIP